MNNPSLKKTWIISGGIIAIALVAYFAFFSGNGSTEAISSLESEQNNQVVGARVLSLLNQVQSLNIDVSFFQDQTYQSLQDYAVAVPPQEVGRQNPFAPVPGIRTNPEPRGR